MLKLYLFSQYITDGGNGEIFNTSSSTSCKFNHPGFQHVTVFAPRSVQRH